MAQPIVRNLEDEVVDGFNARAAAHGRSAEAEHREVLRAAFKGPAAGRSLWDRLTAMPDVGDGADFEASREPPRDVAL